MKRLLRLVLWLFLLLVQQKITVAIPLRNEPRQHIFVSSVLAPDSPSLAARATGLPKRSADLPLTKPASRTTFNRRNHKAIDAQQLRVSEASRCGPQRDWDVISARCLRD